MKIILCDRCGRDATKDYCRIEIMRVGDTVKQMDLCITCHKMLKKFIRLGREENETD